MKTRKTTPTVPSRLIGLLIIACLISTISSSIVYVIQWYRLIQISLKFRNNEPAPDTQSTKFFKVDIFPHF